MSSLSHSHTQTRKGSILEYCAKILHVTLDDRHHYDVCHYFVNSSPLDNVTARN